MLAILVLYLFRPPCWNLNSTLVLLTYHYHCLRGADVYMMCTESYLSDSVAWCLLLLVPYPTSLSSSISITSLLTPFEIDLISHVIWAYSLGTWGFCSINWDNVVSRLVEGCYQVKVISYTLEKLYVIIYFLSLVIYTNDYTLKKMVTTL